MKFLGYKNLALCETGSIPEYVVDAQNCFEPGRIVAVAFIKTSYTFTDITDPTEWQTAITAGDVKIHKKVRGSYPAASDVTAPGLGNQESQVIGATHQMTFVDTAIKGNSGYWNAFRLSNAWKVAFVVGKDYDKLFEVDATVQISARQVVEESLDSRVVWQVNVGWSDIDSPTVGDVPAGVFT